MFCIGVKMKLNLLKDIYLYLRYKRYKRYKY